jgi:phenylalanyl-tRNA synthetase beta subunit
MNTDRNNLQTQFDKSLQILKDKRNDLISKLKIFDSYASSLNSSKTSIKVTYQPNDEQR